MLGKLRNWLSPQTAVPSTPMPDTTVLAPEKPFFAIGDIHGCDKLLAQLMEKLHSAALGDETLVVLGDMIDRGPNSAAVLEQLFTLSQEHSDGMVCLMGNHEKMMLEFFEDPAGRGARWLSFGGLETLASYGIRGVPKTLAAEDSVEIANALEKAMPAEIINWVKALPAWWRSGNMVCVHAGLDPEMPPEKQRSYVKIWGHPEFLDKPRQDGLSVVYGHTIVAQPSLRHGRIAVDTGAHMTGRLTAAWLRPDQCDFLST